MNSSEKGVVDDQLDTPYASPAKRNETESLKVRPLGSKEVTQPVASATQPLYGQEHSANFRG